MTSLTYLVTSDIHLGHKRTPTKHIISSFKSYILSSANKNIQILFISGDLFDRLLDLNSIEVHEIIHFFNYLLSYCYENSIQLRILEGTPSHDWNQSYILVKLNDIRENKCDLRYFKHLDIEHNTKHDKYILYIPDEWVNDHIELEKQIQKKLIENNISSVDIAVLHGQFEYQLRGHRTAFFFQENYFLSLVKEYIHIGHYHSFSRYDRIVANGSLERLSFNEEEPKGYVKITNGHLEFIENKNAYIYKTLQITPGTTLTKLDAQVLKYPKESYIRLFISPKSPFINDKMNFSVRYIDYNIKVVTRDDSDINTTTYILTDENDIHIDLSTFHIDNLNQYLYEQITSKNTLSTSQLANLTSVLQRNV